jgi:hypothetical protein
MKPDWDTLANEYKDSQTVIIADVDCTAGGESLCKKHGVSGYPTIKTFSPGSDEGDAYEGGRDLDALRKHADSLGPTCSIDNKDLCSDEDLKKLEKYAAMSQERRTAKLTKLKNAIAKKEHEHEKLQKSLSARYEASNSRVEKLKEEYQPKIKMMTAATPKPA